jgi:signal transduction histidine kinase/DNA-binding response OmpR family regulator/HAMP domain-containing protein
LNSFASEVTRVAREVGTEGKLGGQATVSGVAGTWKDLTDNVNLMANNLTSQVRNIAEVSTAIATGDLSKKITADAQGEILELKNTINTMVDQLNSFASEVTRVAREVGTEGKLGGQATVSGVAGTWKDLTDNVNSMANNLTDQVRGIARIVTAVATGDLTRKLTLDAKGEIAALADTINELTYTLATFADQVSTVAREVGIEGKLGGQAKVPGASGTWRDLTDNVNQLAANLTTQIRTIAEIATAVTKGDLTRSIAVEAQGEVAELKDNINQMIANLRDTTKKNTEQDWLKTNLARFTRMLQGQRELEMVSRLILSELAPLVFAHVGLFYLLDTEGDEPQLKLLSSYAYRERKHLANRFRFGEGLIGQCALEKERILLTEVPPDYIKISSGIGEASPLTIVALPVLFEGEVKAVIELASFHRFSEIHLTFLDQLTESIAIVLNTIGANTRTEELLKQSQSLAEELQGQQRELTETNQRLKEQARSLQASEELLKQQREQLQQTNEELEEKAELLARQNTEVERKNAEIELARQAIEEKAEQLAISSKYKSEFLANMSHELRTPLNSMLILSKLLSENHDNNLTPKQIEFAQTIYASGTDLLSLINEILDLAKIESGTMSIETGEVRFNEVWMAMEQTFAQIAQEKGLKFMLSFDSTLPTSFYTDNKRLLQILRNLLSNAFKFTHQGSVELQIRRATDGWSYGNQVLQRADEVIAFAVADTGIGISPDKQQVIFEAFQQADGTTSRKYGGTGLGLSISREIARLLGGEITLVSEPGKGSIFTVFLPMRSHMSVFETSEPRPHNGTGLIQELGGQRPLLSGPSQDGYASHAAEYDDDRNLIMPGDRVLLIIEEDSSLAKMLLNVARQSGFKGLVALRSEQGLALAQQFKPAAITLNMDMPPVGSWTLLDRLKYDPVTRHIPIQLISGRADRQHGLQLGATAHLHQPVVQQGIEAALTELKAMIDEQVRNILVVEHDTERREHILAEISQGEVLTHAVGSGDEALRVLQTSQFDCLLTALELPDMSGFELIRHIQYEMSSLTMPIVIYTNQGLDAQQIDELRHMTDTVTMKHVHSPERLLAETTLFLHRVATNLNYAKHDMGMPTNTQVLVVPPKKVLLVDDDVRNIFALASVLERYDMEILYVENGLDAIRMLEQTPDIDVILMDVMIPELDGYETMRAIRSMPKYRDLPIIALTAKAMQGDRERCLAAGASDYITKPVDTERLLSLLHVAPPNSSQPS